MVTPVGAMCYKDECVEVNGGGVGKHTQALYDTLTGIQTGRIADKFGWIRKL